MKKKIPVLVCTLAAAVSLFSVTAFAAETDAANAAAATPATSYSYLTGQKRSQQRNNLYAQTEGMTDEERAAFLAGYGIADTPWSEEAAAGYSYMTGKQRGASYSVN